MAAVTEATEQGDMDLAARAVAEPRRREILALVRDEELSAGEIASNFTVSRPAISQHIAVLREAGLLNERRQGTRRLYRARPEGMAELCDFLNRFWINRLERLRLAAELEQQRRAAVTASAGSSAAGAPRRPDHGSGQASAAPRRSRRTG